MILAAPELQHGPQQEKLKKAAEIFETCPFNTYTGPEKPELLIVTSSACSLYSREAVRILGLEERVGILKLATTWPLPAAAVEEASRRGRRSSSSRRWPPPWRTTSRSSPPESVAEIGVKTFYGKKSGHLALRRGAQSRPRPRGAFAHLRGCPRTRHRTAFKRDVKALAANSRRPAG